MKRLIVLSFLVLSPKPSHAAVLNRLESAFAPLFRAVPDSSTVVKAVPLKNFNALIIYPEDAKKVGMEGIAIIRMLVGEDGKVKQTVLDSATYGLFGKEATRVANQMEFKAATRDGTPVESWCKQQVTFKLGAVQKTLVQSAKDEPIPAKDDFVEVSEEPKPLLDMMSLIKYPLEARQRGLEGEVMVEMLISKDGKVERVEVSNATDKLFADEAIRAAMLMKFTPAKLTGEPVRIWFTQQVKFKLNQHEDTTAPVIRRGAKHP